MYWRRATALIFETAPQRVHKIYNIRGASFFWRLDLLSILLFLQQLSERILVMIFKLLRPKRAALGVDNVFRQIEHFFGQLLIRDIREVVLLFSHFIGISQRDPQQALPASLEGDDMLTSGEYYLPQRNDAFDPNRFANDRESLLADLSVRRDVIQIA